MPATMAQSTTKSPTGSAPRKVRMSALDTRERVPVSAARRNIFHEPGGSIITPVFARLTLNPGQYLHGSLAGSGVSDFTSRLINSSTMTVQAGGEIGAASTTSADTKTSG